MYYFGAEKGNAVEQELIDALGEETLQNIGQDMAEIIRKNKLQHSPALCRKLFYWLSGVVDGWNCV